MRVEQQNCAFAWANDLRLIIAGFDLLFMTSEFRKSRPRATLAKIM
jgi:hypothetical protein